MEQNCRMCLIEDKHGQFQDFELNLEDSLSVYDYYKLFTSISLRNQDERTKSKICHKCLQKLLLFYNDRCKAITNNKILWKRSDEASDPTAGSQESTEVKDEPNIYPAEAPSTSVGIDDIKLEDNIQLDGPPVTTEVVKEEYVISDHQDSIAPLSYLCVSLTKPCKVVLKRWVKSCNNDKSKDPLEKNGNTDQDTSDQRNLNEARQENETIINGLEPVVQKENLPASRMTKSREKGVKKLKPIKRSIPKKALRSNKNQHHQNTDTISGRDSFDDPQEPTDTEIEEYAIYGHQDSIDPLFNSVGIEDIKSEDELHEEPTSGVESSTISHHNLESLTKPCKVVLEKCDKVSFQDKREVPLEKTIEKIQDTPDLDDRAENEKCIDELEPVTINSAVQSEILPATKVVKKTQRNKTNINQIKQVPCSICGKIMRYDAIRQHKKSVHLKLQRYFCGICSNGYYKKSTLKKHEESHLEPTIPCTMDGCYKMFKSETKLQIHLSGSHFGSEAIIPCTYPSCGKTYNKYNLLKRHIKYKHEQERTYICTVCKKGFLSASDCKLHMTTHEEKNLICDGCGKRFSNKMRLITHYRQSHWAAPLVCSTCGQKFKKYMNRALRLHEQRHHAHQMTKKNPCGICKNTFESSIIMFEHVRAVHFKSKMKCEHCETFFPRQEVYQDHVKAKHADIGPERMKKLLVKIDNIRADYEDMDWVYE